MIRSFLIFLAFYSSCVSWADEILQFGEPDNRVMSLSLIALISNPDKYQGKLVRVEGAFRYEFEGNAICLSKDDLKYRMGKNCLAFNLDPKMIKSDDALKLNGHYVLVEGMFDSSDTGHFGMNSGCIKDIWRAMSLERKW